MGGYICLIFDTVHVTSTDAWKQQRTEGLPGVSFTKQHIEYIKYNKPVFTFRMLGCNLDHFVLYITIMDFYNQSWIMDKGFLVNLQLGISGSRVDFKRWLCILEHVHFQYKVLSKSSIG